MLIAFAGRMRSGKTELANICVKKGFEKIYFALPLKQLCANLLNISISKLNKLKVDKTEINLKIDNDLCKKISEETEIPLDVVEKTCNDVIIKDVRHMLQFIGTDLIRKYNTDWHVNKVRQMIDASKNYVIDDVRFKNELALVRELGGDCWFVIRPRINNISNHESETSLTWKDFGNKIIINDGSLELFTFRWETFLNTYEKSVVTRDKCLGERNITNLFGELSEPLCILELLEISPYLFSYFEHDFNMKNVAEITQGEDNGVDIEYKDGTHEIIKNPMAIEDLKMFL